MHGATIKLITASHIFIAILGAAAFAVRYLSCAER
jgi:hypothetical protein